jgi:hypothetical protein
MADSFGDEGGRHFLMHNCVEIEEEEDCALPACLVKVAQNYGQSHYGALWPDLQS